MAPIQQKKENALRTQSLSTKYLRNPQMVLRNSLALSGRSTSPPFDNVVGYSETSAVRGPQSAACPVSRFERDQ